MRDEASEAETIGAKAREADASETEANRAEAREAETEATMAAEERRKYEKEADALNLSVAGKKWESKGEEGRGRG